MSCLKWLSANIPGVTQPQNPSKHKRAKRSRPSLIVDGSPNNVLNMSLPQLMCCYEKEKKNIYCKIGEGGRLYALEKDGE